MKSIQEIFANAKKLKPEEAKAKAESLKEMMASLKEVMGKDLQGLKKVTVASDSDEGLEEGLEKAKEVLEAKESPEAPEMGESCEMSEDDKIAKLEKELADLKAKKKGEEISSAKANIKEIF